MGLTGFNRARREAELKAAHIAKTEKVEAVPVAPATEPIEKETVEAKVEAVSPKKEHAVGKKKGATNADPGSK